MKDAALIVPRNDEESLQIIKIAEAFKIPMHVSTQPHGAKLHKEKGLLNALKALGKQHVVIVEIPGEDVEQDLRAAGYHLTIIDHHRYDDLDRTESRSSLEQFLNVYEITNDLLILKGFDPKMIQAVGALDRGFVWELKRSGFEGEAYDKALDYYRSLTLELGPERRKKEEAAAEVAWNARYEEHGVLCVESDQNEPSIRDAISFFVAKAYPEHPPQVYVRQGTRRVYVQETPHAKELHKQFGGFTFGGDACWGVLVEPGKELPAKETIFSVIT